MSPFVDLMYRCPQPTWRVVGLNNDDHVKIIHEMNGYSPSGYVTETDVKPANAPLQNLPIPPRTLSIPFASVIWL